MTNKLSLLGCVRILYRISQKWVKNLIYGLPPSLVAEVRVVGSSFDWLALERTMLGRTLPSDVDGLGRLAIACLTAANFSPSPEAAPTLVVLRSPRLGGGTVSWGVWIGCAEERVRELADELDVTLVSTFLAVKEIDLVEELLWTTVGPRLAARPRPDVRVLRPESVLDLADFLGNVGSGGTTDSRLLILVEADPNVEIRLVDGAVDSGIRWAVKGRDVAIVEVLR